MSDPTDRLEAALIAGRAALSDIGAPPPPPSLAALRGRAPLSSPSLETLVEGLEAFPEGAWRSGHGGLEVEHAGGALRAWDPEAEALLFIQVSPGPARLLASAPLEGPPGRELSAPLRPEVATELAVLSARQPLSAPLWCLWLDAQRAEGRDLEQAATALQDQLHLRVLRLPADPDPVQLEVQPAPLGEACPAVAERLTAAAKAGRGGRLGEAARAYAEAHAIALTENDAPGLTRAGLGLALALTGLGHREEAQRLLAELASSARLDARWARSLAEQLLAHAQLRGAFEEAEAWLDAMKGLAEAGDARVRFAERELASARRQPLRALSALAEPTEAPADPAVAPADPAVALAERAVAPADPAVALAEPSSEMSTSAGSQGAQAQRTRAQSAGSSAKRPPSTLSPAALACDLAAEVEALADLGRTERAALALGRLEASAAMSPGAASPSVPLELRLRRALARAAADQLSWPALLEELQDHASSERSFNAVEAALLARLAERALLQGAPAVSADLLCARFLGDARAPGQLLGLTHAPQGALRLRPSGRVDQLPVGMVELADLARRARLEVQAEGPGPQTEALRALLLGEERPEGALWLASDGALQGAPVAALLPGVAVRSVLSASRPVGAPEHDAVVSFADSLGDLPLAADEVREAEARLRLRGAEVTRAALMELEGPVGLLHLGLHVRRVAGQPRLRLSDGELGPSELAELRLSGHPLVLLSGCASAARGGAEGSERSLAEAFVRAGASAVIATRWPVQDAHGHAIVRALLARWPFTDPAQVVAELCLALRARGLPASAWAAPVVS